MTYQNRYIDKQYLLDTLRNFDKEILSKKYSSSNQHGKDAPTITDIMINDDNILIVTLSDGTVLNGGIIKTLPGEKGDNGVTPHIDQNTKHWFIGDIDTNIVAEGKDGNPGEPGASATINGVSTLTIEAGEGISIDQIDNTCVISLTDTSSENLPDIVTWADGTDEQITAMLDAHYTGTINIHDYWTVGDERMVHLSAMQAKHVDDSHVEQNVTMVLMNEGGKTLAEPINGHNECAFIVGQKNSLLEAGNINPTATCNGGWDGCARRVWCNEIPKRFACNF